MTRLTVAIRVRPLSERELASKSVSIVSVENGKTVAVTNIKVPEQNAGDSRERVRRFNFDYCFNYKSTQENVYWKIGEEIVKGLRTRVHSCILAYGQSASGKTHTMIGEPEDDGVVPRLCQNVFNYLTESAVGSELENINVTVSFLEIYNEKVRDLLNPEAKNLQHKNANATLKVREHPKTGPYVPGLLEQTVSDSNGLLSLLHAGNANRTIGATNANPRSSRSHSVFTITCFGGLKLKFVDLAGSERAGSHTTSRFREGSNINKSLVALRNVISALADWSKLAKSKKRFVPYRDSVLTWLLKDTLGGNSKTILISTVSPASTCYNETVNTLRFGQRAKQIAVQPFFNEDPKEKTIRELRAEIAKLREQLEYIQKPLSSTSATLIDDNSQPASISGEILEILNENGSDSDSGVSVCDNLNAISAEEDEDQNIVHTHNELKPLPLVHLNSNIKHATKPNIISVDKLIPLITTEMAELEKSKSRPIQRTISVDKSGDIPNSAPNSEEPSIGSTEKAKKATLLRKTSADKSNASLKSSNSKKTEAKTKIEPKPKVDSHRRTQPKPRSQIVAAVTQRLYNKVKKKDVATDTLDLSNPIRDLSITSKARFNLQELTHKALKAHRRKNAETQTSLFPVVRFKETSTDVDDLKLLSEEIVHVDTATDAIDVKDASTNCTFIETMQSQNDERMSTIILTRSCGTSTDNLIAHSKPLEEKSSLSFTKYLMPPQQASPTFEIINPATANPIYTASVNINVNHNYNNKLESGNNNHYQATYQLNDNLSDDSLEESQCQSNVCFPTPDLISNHNSLDPHAQQQPSTSTNIRFAASSSVENPTVDDAFNTLTETNPAHSVCIANCALDDSHIASTQSIIETQYASEMSVQDNFDDDYDIFYKAPPQKYRSNISHDHLNDPVHANEPVILKSIMKCNDNLSEDYDNESIHLFDNIPDSLNYYYEKERKTVRFDSPTSTSIMNGHNERMFDAMTNFMKEVTSLMTNLTKVAGRLDAHEAEHSYDMHVIVNDINGLNEMKCSTCNNCAHGTTSLLSESTQTLPISTSDCGTDMDCATTDFPVNKFEALLESSCKRLENTIEKCIGCERRNVMHRMQPSFSITHDWNNYRNVVEDSSIESQPTFSDYGSLPRRRNRSTFSSPSSYLRQLTNMRREIVRTSRDELLQEAEMHL